MKPTIDSWKFERFFCNISIQPFLTAISYYMYVMLDPLNLCVSWYKYHERDDMLLYV